MGHGLIGWVGLVDTLEPRVLAAADLVGRIDVGGLPVGTLVPFDRGTVSVVVRNQGDAPAAGRIAIDVFASTDRTPDAGDVPLASLANQKVGLQPGQQRAYRVKVAVPGTLPAGDYFLAAAVDSGGAVAEADEANNLALTEATQAVAYRFGTVDGRTKVKLSLPDADGSLVTFTLKGPGTGDVTAPTAGGGFGVVLTGTTAGTTFSVAAKGGDGRAVFDDVRISGPLKGLAGKSLTLAGDVAVAGALGGVKIGGDVTGTVAAASLGTLTIGGNVTGARILAGADLGADGHPGGTGADADTFAAGSIADLKVGGRITNSLVGAGFTPADGVFGNTDDGVLGGAASRIGALSAAGGADDASTFWAGAFPKSVKFGRVKFDPLADPRFRSTPPAADVSVLLRDDFDGTALDLSKWSLPSGPGSFVGRTQFRPPGMEPEVAGGVARLRFDTFNPSALVPGDSFFGTEIGTNQAFDRGTGLSFAARVRVVGPVPSGLVSSLFSFVTDGTVRDEIDFELLSNDLNAGRPRVLTNVFDNDDFAQPGDKQFADVPGLDLTQFNTFAVEWLPDRVRWLVNGQLVRETTATVPDQPMNVRLNFWGPDANFAEAFDAGLQPAASAGANQAYYYEVDSVEVRRTNGS